MAAFKDVVDYLREVFTRGGSDLHLTVGAPPAARINGVLEPLEEIDLDKESAKQMVFSMLTEAQRSTLESEWELDFALHVKDTGRFRGNAHYASGNVEVVFRLIPEKIPQLEELGHSAQLDEICNLRQGLFLVTGVTGSGKSTTLASMVRRVLERRSCVVVSIEDPIEYQFDHSYGIVKQREIGTDTKSFSKALRQAMRQDPDVILVSELRDLETISTAITAAETGHLVFSTLHTMDAPKALDRLIDVFPPEQQTQIITQLSNCLLGVLSQRLIKRVDQPGRVMATEIMMVNQGVRACLKERRFEQLVGLMQIGAQDGMHTIDESIAHLLKGGYISEEDAYALCRDQVFVEENSVPDPPPEPEPPARV